LSPMERGDRVVEKRGVGETTSECLTGRKKERRGPRPTVAVGGKRGRRSAISSEKRVRCVSQALGKKNV